jgi:hypothetical protein
MHGTGCGRVRTGDGRARCIADLSGNPRCGLLRRRVKRKQQKQKRAASGQGRAYKRTNRANVPSPCPSKTDSYACHIQRSPFMRELCFHAGRRRALISGCSRRLVLSGGASHRSEPSIRKHRHQSSAAAECAAHLAVFDGNCRQKWRCTTFLDKLTTRPEGALRNNGFDYSALWFVLLVCVRTHRWGGEKQTWATVLDKRFSGESATITL